ISSGRRFSSFGASRTKTRANPTAAAANGILRRNIDRQPTVSMSHPPSTGPPAPITAPIDAQIPTACPRASPEKEPPRADESRYPLTPQRIVHDVRYVMPEEGIVCLDNGMYKIWFARRVLVSVADSHGLRPERTVG